jgi:VWFA-related protein
VTVLPLAVLLVAAGSVQKVPVFEARVEYVYVDAFVTEHGRPVSGLQAADFELQDDGVSQSVELLGSKAAPLRTVLVLDSSDSVRGERLTALKAAGRAFLLSLRAEERATVFTFSQEVRRRGAPEGDPMQMVQEIEGIEGAGSTSVFDALFAAFVTVGKRERGLIVLFSDGADNFSWLRADDVRRVAAQSSALLEVVTVRNGADPSARDHLDTLRDIAGATGGRVWEAESPLRLEEAFAKVLGAMRAGYVLRYEPTGVKGSGEHRLRVRLNRVRGDVRARSGYFRPPAS